MNYILILLVLIWVACSSNDNKIVSGGGTDVSNARIVGQVLNADSTAAASVVVRLYPSELNPYTSLLKGNAKVYETKTDGSGHYEFSVKDTGQFVLDCGNATNNEKTFKFGLNIDAKSKVLNTSVVLTKPGALKIVLPKSLRDKDGLYAYVPGTSYFVHIDESKILNDSIYVLGDLPAVYLPSIHYTLINDDEIDESESIDLEVQESDTTEVGH